MTISRSITTLTVSAGIILVSGCGTMRTYDGVKLPANEIGVLHLKHDWWTAPGARVEVVAIDGRTDIEGRNLQGKVQSIELLPGPHHLTLNFLYGRPVGGMSGTIYATQPSLGMKKVRLNVEAGGQYILEPHANIGLKRYWNPVIRDIGSGQIVASPGE